MRVARGPNDAAVLGRFERIARRKGARGLAAGAANFEMANAAWRNRRPPGPRP